MVGKPDLAKTFRKVRFWLLAALFTGLSLVLHSPAVQSQSTSASEHSPLSISVSQTELTLDLSQSAEADSLLEAGRTQYDQGQIEAAIALWTQASQAYDAQENISYQAIAYTYLSLAYQDLGDWDNAEGAIATSLNLIQEQLSADVQQTPVLAQALTARGRLELSMGQAETALATWQAATTLYRELDDSVGTTGSLLNQALALEMLGFYRRSCSTVLEAVGFEDSCQAVMLADIERLIDQFAAQVDNDLHIEILGLRNLGNILRLMGNVARSQQVLEQTLALSNQSASIQETVDTQLSLANTEYALYQQAQDLYERTNLESDRTQIVAAAQQALRRYQDIIETTDSLPRSQISTIQAQLQRFRLLLDFEAWAQIHDPSANAEAFRTAIQTQIQDLFAQNLENLPPSQTAVYLRLDFAESLVKADLSWIDTAIQIADVAAEQAEQLTDRRSQSYASGILGRLYEQQGVRQPEQFATARQLSEDALGIAQAIQAWDIAYQWQWQIGRIYRKQGDREKAIAYYQTAVDTLQSVRKNLVATETDLRFSFRDTVEPVYRELVALLLGNVTAEDITQLNLRQAVQTIDALQLSELENFLRCDLAPSVAIDEVQIDPEAAVLYTVILENQLAVVLQLPEAERLHFHTVPLPKADVDQTLIALKSELTRPYVSPRSLALEQAVYEWLIRPIESNLAANHVQTLVFVLDGELRSVPMAALHDGESYLIEHYAIALSPGLQLLQPYPLKHLPLRALTFGLSETRQDFSPHSGFPPLENVEVEVQTIQNSLDGQALLNEEFTSAAMQDWISTSSAPIVHMATHGQFSSNPNETFVLAWDERVNVNELGTILQSRGLTNPDPIELLVLSACKTADGDRRAALGLAGVAVQSGARSTIASLWSVDDESTAALMGLFYEELTDSDAPIGKAETLRRAQVRLLQSRGYRAPLFWAPYVLVGNWL